MDSAEKARAVSEFLWGSSRINVDGNGIVVGGDYIGRLIVGYVADGLSPEEVAKTVDKKFAIKLRREAMVSRGIPVKGCDVVNGKIRKTSDFSFVVQVYDDVASSIVAYHYPKTNLITYSPLWAFKAHFIGGRV